jgi:hypothetical protein
MVLCLFTRLERENRIRVIVSIASSSKDFVVSFNLSSVSVWQFATIGVPTPMNINATKNQNGRRNRPFR